MTVIFEPYLRRVAQVTPGGSGESEADQSAGVSKRGLALAAVVAAVVAALAARRLRRTGERRPAAGRRGGDGPQ